MKKRFLRPAVHVAPALSAAGLVATPASAQLAKAPPAVAPKPIPRVAVEPPPDIVRITDFQISPALPNEGDSVTASLVIKNESAATLTNLQYTLAAGYTKDGVIPSLAPQASTTVRNTFVVSRGALSMLGIVDPNNALRETSERARNNKVSLQVNVLQDATADWSGWATKASEHVSSMITQYKRTAAMRGKINGPALEVTGIVLEADQTALKAQLIHKGLPSDIAAAISQAFDRAFSDWASGYHAVVPWAFPAFAAFPGASAPSMPATPFPLSMGASSNSTALLPNTVEAKLRRELTPNRLTLTGADDAIRALALAISGQMTAWIAVQQVTVSGSGRVPSFAPPYVPVGPVVNGSLNSGPGALSH